MSKENPNPWNLYQEEMVKILGKEYDPITADKKWKMIADKKDLSSFIEWKTSEDVYESEAYKAKYTHIERKKKEEVIKGEKVKNNGNPWNIFRHNYKKEYPNSTLEEAKNAYEGVQNDEKKANEKIKKKFRDSEKKKGTNKNIFEDLKEIIQNLIQGHKKYNKRDYESWKIDNDTEFIYNKVIKCYINSLRTKMMQEKKILVKSTNNNFYKNPDNNNVTLVVADNNLFEQMSKRDIIPNDNNLPKNKRIYKFGTLVDNTEHFIVCYNFLESLIEIYGLSNNRRSIEKKLFRIFVHVGFMGYIFKEVPKLDDFFCDSNENVYYLNLNNLEYSLGYKSDRPANQEIFLNQYKFMLFRKEFIKTAQEKRFNNIVQIFIKYDTIEYSGLTPEYANDTDFERSEKRKIRKKWKEIISRSKKRFGKPEKIDYKPMYITGAILAALAFVGINNIYKSFKEKPNEFSKR